MNLKGAMRKELPIFLLGVWASAPVTALVAPGPPLELRPRMQSAVAGVRLTPRVKTETWTSQQALCISLSSAPFLLLLTLLCLVRSSSCYTRTELQMQPVECLKEQAFARVQPVRCSTRHRLALSMQEQSPGSGGRDSELDSKILAIALPGIRVTAGSWTLCCDA